MILSKVFWQSLSKLNSEKPPVLMNIGNNHPVTVNDLVSELEHALGQ